MLTFPTPRLRSHLLGGKAWEYRCSFSVRHPGDSAALACPVPGDVSPAHPLSGRLPGSAVRTPSSLSQSVSTLWEGSDRAPISRPSASLHRPSRHPSLTAACLAVTPRARHSSHRGNWHSATRKSLLPTFSVTYLSVSARFVDSCPTQWALLCSSRCSNAGILRGV